VAYFFSHPVDAGILVIVFIFLFCCTILGRHGPNAQLEITILCVLLTVNVFNWSQPVLPPEWPAPCCQG